MTLILDSTTFKPNGKQDVLATGVIIHHGTIEATLRGQTRVVPAERIGDTDHIVAHGFTGFWPISKGRYWPARASVYQDSEEHPAIFYSDEAPTGEEYRRKVESLK